MDNSHFSENFIGSLISVYDQDSLLRVPLLIVLLYKEKATPI